MKCTRVAYMQLFNDNNLEIVNIYQQKYIKVLRYANSPRKIDTESSP